MVSYCRGTAVPIPCNQRLTSDVPGLITGVAGAAGDLGGIIYLLIARYNGTQYAKVFWTVGLVNIGASLLVAWIRPVPKGQVVAR